MEIRISDDFDLKKIIDSGQCFRPKETEAGLFRFIIGDHILYIRELGEGLFDINCSADEWAKVWTNYFDLETNYSEIRSNIAKFAAGKPYEKTLCDMADFGKGIRILRQDPFEMLISFIISQRKNIPSIRSSIERICERFGRLVGDVYLFPRIEDMTDLTVEDLTELGLAYRKEYILDALDHVASGAIDLVEIESFADNDLVEELKLINGVGDKIANCVALFAYHRVNRAPVDVWIRRAIDKDFSGKNIFSEFGAYAGILQQYVFYYKRLNK